MIDRYLAILESEMLCKNLHSSVDVLAALECVRQYKTDKLYQLSKFKADEIDRICNYWRGL